MKYVTRENTFPYGVLMYLAFKENYDRVVTKRLSVTFKKKDKNINKYENLKNPTWPPGGPKIADGVWKGVYPQVFGRSKQLSLNKRPRGDCLKKFI